MGGFSLYVQAWLLCENVCYMELSLLPIAKTPLDTSERTINPSVDQCIILGASKSFSGEFWTGIKWYFYYILISLL
jgi:hypothetical protein